MDSCTGKTGPHSRGREKLRARLANCARFLGFPEPPRCAVSSEAQMTANPLLRHAVGGGMRCCETDWQQLGRIEKSCAWCANHLQLRADDGLAPETGRWVLPGLTSQIDPKATFTNPPAREVIPHGKDEFLFLRPIRCRRLALTPPSLLKFSNFERLPGASTDGHDKVLRPGMGGRLAADSRQQQGKDLAGCRTASAAVNCQSRGQSSAVKAVVIADTKHFPARCEARLSLASHQRSPGPSRRPPLHIVARFCAQRRQRSQGSRGGRRRLLRWRRSCARRGSRTVRLLPGKCRI
jgi:hypothetical protein